MMSLRKILFKKQKPIQLFIAATGAFAGILILLLSIDFYISIKTILLKESEIFGDDLLVIQKQTNDLNTLGLSSNTFSDKEIEEIKKEPYIKGVAIFRPALFSANASLKGAGDMPDMMTDTYFESLPDEYIEVKTNTWEWNEGDEEVPVILPGSFLDSYNYGFAPSQNLPPISEKTIGRLRFNIKIYGFGVNFTGIVTGFSYKLNTILVPESFLIYANTRFAQGNMRTPTRLVIKTDDITNPRLAEFLEQRGYITHDERLEGSRVKTLLNISMLLFLMIGVIIVMLSLLSFVQYSRLLITNIQYELKILLLLGYSYKTPAKQYLINFGITTVIIVLAALLSAVFIKAFFETYMKSYGFEVSQGLNPYLYLLALLFTFTYIAVNAISINITLKDLAKNL